MEKFLVAITGPTASGKTAMAIGTAKVFGTEIISADARQVYREIPIGTATPDDSERRAAKHHLVGHRSIREEYNAAQYASEARETLERLFENHNVVIVCGGSGLYLQAMIDGVDDIPDTPDKLRETLNAEFNERGLTWLQQEAARSDPEWFARADQRNPRRLLRALEVFRHTGKPISNFQSHQPKPLPCQLIHIGLFVPRPVLYQRIADRVDRMLEKGLWEEAEGLHHLRHLQALQTVGYREIFNCIDGITDRNEAIRLIKQNTRHYAKRQMTWFRRDERTRWFDFNDETAIGQYIRQTIG